MQTLSKVISALALGVAAMSAHAAPIVDNGQFSTAFNPAGSDWSVQSGAVNLSGGFALLAANSSIVQSIDLEWNKTYQLSFLALGAGMVDLYDYDFQLGSTPGGAALDTQSFASGSYTFYFSTGPQQVAGNPYSWSHLRFSSQDGAGIDNVSVTAVPEPETYAMMLAGLGAIGMMARRRKTRA